MRGARRVASHASDLQRRSAPETSASDVQFFDERTFGRASVPGRPSGGWESGPWPGTSSVGLKSIGRDSDAIHCRLPAFGCRLSAVGLADEGEAAAKHQVASKQNIALPQLGHQVRHQVRHQVLPRVRGADVADVEV